MGRYLTPSGGAGGSAMRNQRHIIKTSNPTLAVPPWAKMLRVSGVGAGAGGNVNALGGGDVKNGMGGGIARDANMLIPSGTTTIAVVIGAGGVGKAAGSNGDGAPGGDTSITVAGMVMMLEGGKPAPVYGNAWVGSSTATPSGIAHQVMQGLSGGYPDGASGGASPYGAVGESKASGTADGGNATGYGAGGGGSTGGKGGNGSPGLVIIEFLEAV